MFRIALDTADTRRALELAKHDLGTEMPNLMELVGVSVLSEAQLAYLDKSRGGTGSDGIAWAALARATLAARVGRVGRGKTIIAKRKELADQIRSMLASKPNSRGKGAPATADGRAAARSQGKSIEKRIERLRDQRKKLRSQFERLVDAAVGNHSIGVDTGLQRASAQPGFAGNDGEGGNVFKLNGNQVTVGYGRSYSEYFDEKRKLLPTDLPKSWQDSADEVAQGWADDIIKRHFTQ